jgi:hypothetical protein
MDRTQGRSPVVFKHFLDEMISFCRIRRVAAVAGTCLSFMKKLD